MSLGNHVIRGAYTIYIQGVMPLICFKRWYGFRHHNLGLKDPFTDLTSLPCCRRIKSFCKGILIEKDACMCAVKYTNIDVLSIELKKVIYAGKNDKGSTI